MPAAELLLLYRNTELSGMHDSSRLQYYRTKLHQAEKRKTPVEGTEDSKCYSQKYTCLSLGEKESYSEMCFFCDKPTASAEHQYLRWILSSENVP